MVRLSSDFSSPDVNQFSETHAPQGGHQYGGPYQPPPPQYPNSFLPHTQHMRAENDRANTIRGWDFSQMRPEQQQRPEQHGGYFPPPPQPFQPMGAPPHHFGQQHYDQSGYYPGYDQRQPLYGTSQSYQQYGHQERPSFLRSAGNFIKDAFSFNGTSTYFRMLDAQRHGNTTQAQIEHSENAKRLIGLSSTHSHDAYSQPPGSFNVNSAAERMYQHVSRDAPQGWDHQGIPLGPQYRPAAPVQQNNMNFDRVRQFSPRPYQERLGLAMYSAQKTMQDLQLQLKGRHPAILPGERPITQEQNFKDLALTGKDLKELLQHGENPDISNMLHKTSLFLIKHQPELSDPESENFLKDPYVAEHNIANAPEMKARETERLEAWNDRFESSSQNLESRPAILKSIADNLHECNIATFRNAVDIFFEDTPASQGINTRNTSKISLAETILHELEALRSDILIQQDPRQTVNEEALKELEQITNDLYLRNPGLSIH